MSQHDLTIDNQGFPAFRADLNNALQALGSTQSGTSAPSPTFANQLWYDTTNNQLKIRNEDNDAWITLLTLDQTADSVSQLATAIAVLSAGTAGAPALTTLGDTNTGIFFPAADTIAFAEGGAEAMRIDSSGNVGINNTSPTRKIDVAGTMGITDTITSSKAVQAFLSNPTTGTDGSYWQHQNTGGSFFIGQENSAGGLITGSAYAKFVWGTGAYPLIFGTNNAERLRITSGGNLLVSTTSESDSTHTIFKAGTSTTAPTTVLTLQSTITSGTTGFGARIAFNNIQNNGNTYTGAAVGSVNESTSSAIGTLAFYTLKSATLNERMRINSDGNLLVGTTSFAYANANNFMVEPAIGVIYVQHSTARASGSSYVEFTYNANLIGNIAQNGTTAVSYNTTSDYRLKENITPMTGALEKVSQLKPVTYTWKADGSTGQGFIAHELQTIVPDAVTGEKDAVNEEGKPIYQGVDTSFLVATLTAAIQELKAEVDLLKSKV